MCVRAAVLFGHDNDPGLRNRQQSYVRPAQQYVRGIAGRAKILIGWIVRDAEIVAPAKIVMKTFGMNILSDDILDGVLPGRPQNFINYIGPGVKLISTDRANKF